MSYKHKAVVLGTNYYIGLAVVRSLGKEGIHVISVNHDGPNPYGKSRYVKKNYIGPHYEKEPEEFLRFLIDLAKDEKYKPVLLATADPYVEFMDKYFFELKEYYLFPMDRKGLLTDLMDKEKLVEYAKIYDIRTPEIVHPDRAKDYIKEVEETFSYPCIIKPVDSPTFVRQYRRKTFTAENREDLIKYVDLAQADGHQVFVQRIVQGPETNNYNFDAYMNQEGKIAYYSTERKLRQWPNNFGASTYAEQKWIPKAKDFCYDFLENIGFKGFVEVEMKEDIRNGLIYLIEVNVRFVNFTQMLIDIGMNTPLLTYREMIGEDIGSMAIDYDTGYRWRYLYEDIAAMRNYEKTGQMTREEITEQNRHKPVSASTWDIKDPWPGIKFFFSLVGRRIKRIFVRS